MNSSRTHRNPIARVTRREFVKAAGVISGGAVFGHSLFAAESGPVNPDGAPGLMAAQLPRGAHPAALTFAHFPDRLHAFVWRNWSLVPIHTLAEVVGASTADLTRIGKGMGLPDPPRITPELQRRSYITVIRRNWHLLPYPQLLQLLGWTPAQMAFTLQEDDFLFAKLGELKPDCDPLRYSPPSPEALARERQIARIVREEFPDLGAAPSEPLFGFIGELSRRPSQSGPDRVSGGPARLSPRFCYSYFALYGDPLLEATNDSYPPGYLARLAAAGVEGIWLQGVLQKLAPFSWDTSASAHYEKRLENLGRLVQRARAEGIGVYLYLNEPRSMPLPFFDTHPALKGAAEGERATLCTSHPEVQKWIVDSVAVLGQAVPDLAAVFTIAASENLTNCWSHLGGRNCPRCSKRAAGDVVAELNGLIDRGLRQAGSKTKLIVWDWGWPDDWAEPIIRQLPQDAALMSVSEWSTPIHRGGIENRVGEYSISTIGPGPRAKRHWALARERGLKTIAKIQAGNTWELSAVPYIPALENVGQHAANLLGAKVDGLMLGWTLGGYPSPNIELVMEVARSASEAGGQSVVRPAMERVAARRFGPEAAVAVAQAWHEFSLAFSEFPFDGSVVYNAPMQYGPSNLLWKRPSGYSATMVGFPYDDLKGWRGPYPAEVFIAQFEKIADGFERAISRLKESTAGLESGLSREHHRSLQQELNVAEAAAIHFRSTANQARFVATRDAMGAKAPGGAANGGLGPDLEGIVRAELELAQRLCSIQSADSRIGFEASNQYYYVPLDLVEKVLNCRQIIAG